MSGPRYLSRGEDGRRDYDGYPSRRDYNRDGDGRDGRDRHDGRDRYTDRRPSPQRDARADTYRPSSFSHRENHYSSQDNRRNPPGLESWAPGTDGYRPPPPSYAQPPPPPNHGPRPPQSDFSFRVQKPPGVQEPYDSYRPNTGAVPQFGMNASSQAQGRQPYQSSYRGRDANRRGRGRGSGRGGFIRFKAAERPMLNSSHSTGPEQIYFDTEAEATYRPVDELSDSDEAEMEMSEVEDGTDHVEPSSKRARFGVQKSELDDSVPKWSNPDPYTALPPPDAPSKPRKDVVQLIRKARVETNESKAAIPAEAADFIPCDFDDSDDNSDIEVLDERPTRTASLPEVPTGPKSLQAPTQQDTQQTLTRVTTAVTSQLSQPDNSRDSNLGSRKRTHDDEIKLPAHAKLKRVNMKPGRGGIVSEWRVLSGEEPCPWLKGKHASTSATPGHWLHKEIVDIYDHIKPKDFEEHIRGQLVEQLKKLCRAQYQDAEVYPFGSFPSGLYLPTGDMDLVLLSDSMRDGRGARYSTKTALWALQRMLVNSSVASFNDIEVISKARVPLVKFIDSRTGLKVDVSFENTTGLQAIKTFLHWRDQYPEMPVLVTLIKHFLAMRGLNEPVNGGIGGFSVICLVVSMLQHRPDIQSGSSIGRHNYGELLMDFFDLYGNKFQYQTVAISLNPPAYIPKNRVSGFTYKNIDRLSIIDPNNSANDISGGSSNIGTITELFSNAYRDIRQRMIDLAKAGRHGQEDSSILSVIFAGNYSTFRQQREHLAKLAERGLGPQPEVRKPPPRRKHW